MEPCALNGFYSPAQRARFLNAVSRRVSVRVFSDEPDVAQKSALHYAAARVCLPGVRIVLCQGRAEKLYRWLPGVPRITGSGCYAALIAVNEAPYARLHAGISGEAFVLEAAAMKLGTCWVASYRAGGVEVEIAEGERILAVIALGTPARESHARRRKSLQEICRSDPAAWPLWAYHAAECVRVAPSAMNLQPWRLSYAGRTLMLEKGGIGSEIDLGIALLHMSLGVEDAPHIIRWGEGKEIATLTIQEH